MCAKMQFTDLMKIPLLSQSGMERLTVQALRVTLLDHAS